MQKLHACLQSSITLISAPAGYGKTTLLRDWRDTPSGQACALAWFSVDREENDPAQFLAYTIAALQTAFPQIGKSALPLLQSPEHISFQNVDSVLLEELRSLEQSLILVFDDYHIVTNPEVHDLTAFLLDHLPAPVHAVLLTRTEPPMPLARWRARNQLAELHTDDLRFTHAEAADFLHRTVGKNFSPEDVDLLVGRTEGWASGLQLAAAALQSFQDAAHRKNETLGDVALILRDFHGSHINIADYLFEEVFSLQPEDIRLFLLQTSILERLSVSNCEAVTRNSRSREILEYLEKSNLFLDPMDSKREWYRYHALWAEAMQARVIRDDPDSLKPLHRRASEWWEKNGFPAEAVVHAAQGEDWERVCALLSPRAKQMAMRGENGLLLHWLGWLPYEILDRHPRLLAASAWARIIQGDMEGADSDLTRLRHREQEDPALRGEVTAIRAMVASVRQDIPGMRENAEIALANLSADETAIRSAVLLAQGTAAMLGGEMAEAADLLSRARNDIRRDEQPVIHIAGTSMLAQVYERLGELDRAERLHREIISLEKDPILGGLPLIGIGYVGLGGVLHERLEFEAAENALEKGMALGRKWGSPEIVIGGMFSLVSLRFTQGKLSEALKIVGELEKEFADAIPRPEWAHIQIVKSQIAIAQDDLETADALMQSIRTADDAPATYAEEIDVLGQVRFLLAKNQPQAALEILTVADKDARTRRKVSSLVEILLLVAQARRLLNQGEAADEAFTEAVTLAQPKGMRRVFVDETAGFPLLEAFLAGHPENGFAQDLVTFHKLRASALQEEASLLTEREMDVLKLIAAGCSNQQIADRLVIALSTVKSHVKSIFLKLDAANRTQAVARGRELRFL